MSAETSNRVHPRTVYSHRFAGQQIQREEALRILELQRAVRQPYPETSQEIGEAELEAFAKRTAASDGVLAYLAPEGTDMREFLKTGDRQGTQLTGVAFFGTTTGVLHDIAFDYGTIDSLTTEPDPHSDRQLLETLLEERKNRFVLGLAQKSDERLIATLESLGFELQAAMGEALALGRAAEDDVLGLGRIPAGESLPTINNARRHCDPDPLTDEYIIEEFRELLSEATDFEVDPKIAELAFGRAYALIGDAKENGSGDTLTRETAYSVFSRFLIGRDWPMNRDLTEEGQFERYLEELQVAHGRKLRELEG